MRKVNKKRPLNSQFRNLIVYNYNGSKLMTLKLTGNKQDILFYAKNKNSQKIVTVNMLKVWMTASVKREIK